MEKRHGAAQATARLFVTTGGQTGRLMNPPSQTDIAWFAGLFEGEGTIICSAKNVRIGIGMTDRDVIERVDRLFPSAAGIRREVRPPPRQPMYRWYISRQSLVREILTMILSYLGERRGAAARAAIESINSRPFGGNGQKAKCKRDHPLSGNNVFIDSHGRRQCRICERMRSKLKHQRRMERRRQLAS